MRGRESLPEESMEQARRKFVADSLKRFGHIHHTIHCGAYVTLARILKTCAEMLRDRGCGRVNTMNVDELASALEADELVPILSGKTDATLIHVYLHLEDRVGVKYTRALFEKLQTEYDGESVDAIVISTDGVTPFARKECEGKPVYFFFAKDLSVNITKHCLVPRHERVDALPPGTTLESLPHILDSDKVVQYYNWPIGSIIRIERIFGGFEPVPYYRVVVASSA